MNIILAAIAIVSVQAAPAATVDHSQHTPAQHAQHQQGQKAQHHGEHKCCKQVDGKMECQMMKGHGSQHDGAHGQMGHQGHGSNH